MKMSVEYRIGNVKVQQLHEFGTHARDAMGFLATAIQLDQCRGGSSADKMEALDANLQLWVGVQTIVTASDNMMSASLKAQLVKLRNYVINRILMNEDQEPDDKMLDHFININLQISEGLLESGTNAE